MGNWLSRKVAELQTREVRAVAERQAQQDQERQREQQQAIERDEALRRLVDSLHSDKAALNIEGMLLEVRNQYWKHGEIRTKLSVSSSITSSMYLATALVFEYPSIEVTR